MSEDLKEYRFIDVARTLDSLDEEVEHSDEKVANLVNRYKEALKDFNAVGLKAIVRAMKSDEAAAKILYELIEQPEVMALLSFHGLIKSNTAQQVLEVMEQLKPFFAKEELEVEVIDYTNGVLKLQLPPQGCSSPTGDIIEGISQLMKERVSDFVRIEPMAPPKTPTFISISTLGLRKSEWVQGPALSELQPGQARFIAQESGPGAVAFIKDPTAPLTTENIAVFLNECPHSGLPLRDAEIDSQLITCSWHGYQFDKNSGQCSHQSDLTLQKIEHKVEDGFVWVSA